MTTSVSGWRKKVGQISWHRNSAARPDNQRSKTKSFRYETPQRDPETIAKGKSLRGYRTKNRRRRPKDFAGAAVDPRGKRKKEKKNSQGGREAVRIEC